MSEAVLFLLGVGLTVTVSLAVVVYLRPHLQTILVDLCATAERASFWTAFSSVTLTLVPALFALHYRPGAEKRLVFELSGQMEWALAGLAVSVLMLGIVISRFIARAQPLRQPRQEA